MLEALRRAGILDRIGAGVWRLPSDLAERGLKYDIKVSGGVDVNALSPMPIERQVSAIGATWIDRQMLVGVNGVSKIGFGEDTRQAIRQRTAFLLDQGLAEHKGDRIFVQKNLLAALQAREIKNVSKTIQAETGLMYREVVDGDQVRGVYRRSVTLASGRFAMLDDGVGFSLVPWRPIIDRHLGMEIRGVSIGSTIKLDFARARGLGR